MIRCDVALKACLGLPFSGAANLVVLPEDVLLSMFVQQLLLSDSPSTLHPCRKSLQPIVV